jgi:hypothetical protein
MKRAVSIALTAAMLLGAGVGGIAGTARAGAVAERRRRGVE